MQHTAALQKIDGMKFHVGPKTNQLTAFEDAMRRFTAVRSRRVEAAMPASTHAGHQGALEQCLGARGSAVRSSLLWIQISGNADFMDQLNFESARNKNPMTVFMIRLRRVYRACTIKECVFFCARIGSIRLNSLDDLRVG